MVVNDSSAAAVGNRRRPARDLIAAVVENMRQNLEVLKYSTLAPGRYIVYLHAAEFARLEGILPILQAETVRALSDELGRLNQDVARRCGQLTLMVAGQAWTRAVEDASDA